MLFRLLALLIFLPLTAFAAGWTDLASISSESPLAACALDATANYLNCGAGNPVIDASGHFGIGTTTTNHLLDVNGNIGIAASGYLNFGATDGSTGYGIRDNGGTIECKNSGGSWSACQGSGVASTNFAAGTVSSPGFYVTTDTNTGFYQAVADTLSITAGGSEVARFDNSAAATGVDYFDFAPGATGSPGVITESAVGSDTDINIAMMPKGAGAVGIGTTAPDTTDGYVLDVNGYMHAVELDATNVYAWTGLVNFGYDADVYSSSGSGSNIPLGIGAVAVNTSGATGTGSFYFFQPQNDLSYAEAYIGAIKPASGSSAPIVLGQATGSSSYQERMRIDTSGQVGIGTDTPLANMDVNGTLKVADGGQTCDDSHKGLIRYNAGTGKLQICH